MKFIFIVWGILCLILFVKVWRMTREIHKFANFTTYITYLAHLAEVEAEAGNTEKELEYLRKIRAFKTLDGKYTDNKGRADLKKIAARLKEK